MDNILDEKQPENLPLTDEAIFATIWTSPRRVFRFINDNEYDKHVKVLLVLAGITNALEGFKDLALPLILFIGLSILVGAIFGWLSCYISAVLVIWTGRWIKGKGEVSDLVRVFAYGGLPSAIGLIFIIAEIFVQRSEAEWNSMVPAASNVFTYGFRGVQIVLWTFTSVFAVVGISEVQKFSIGKAILNWLLPALLFLVPVLTVIILLKLF
jgi:hypothetical protein